MRNLVAHTAPFVGVLLIFSKTAVCAGVARDGDPLAKDEQLKACSLIIENRSCFINLGVEGEPLLPSVRVNSDDGTKVELRYFRAPFERIEFDSVTTLVPEPDIGAAVMKQWVAPLQVLSLKTRPQYALKSMGIETLDAKSPLLAKDYRTICSAPFEAFCQNIDGLRNLQAATAKALSDWNTRAAQSVTELKLLKDEKTWPDKTSSSIARDLNARFEKLREVFGDSAVPTACADASAPSAARCALPAEKVAEARQQFELVKSIFISVSPGSTPIYSQLTQDILGLSDSQVELESALAEAMTC